MRLAFMKRYTNALLFCTLSLASQLAHADIIDDAIGNVQQAIHDAYQPDDSRPDDDGGYQESRAQSADRQRQYDDRRQQLEDRRRQLDERQRQLDSDRQQLENDWRRLDEDY
jgi:hypothetical protein